MKKKREGKKGASGGTMEGLTLEWRIKKIVKIVTAEKSSNRL